LKCAPKKFENPAKIFDPSEMPSVMVQTGHVSDMHGPSVMLSVCDVGNACCYPIFDPCFNNFSEKTKNSKKTMKTQKMHF